MMTNYENIPYNDKDKFAEWLSKLGCIEDLPWMKWVDKTYCQKCEPIMGRYPDSMREMEFSPCELGECPYGVDIAKIDDVGLIKLWLEAEAK